MAVADRVRIGIIGSGGIAGAHMHAYAQIPEAQVVAVCDVLPGRAQQFIERHGILGARAYTDHRAMLEADFDAVSVCTFNQAHHRPTVDALTAGKHVICEKPMAVTLQQAVEMADAADANGRMLTIGFQSRYDPNIEMVKRVASSGDLGEVYYFETGGGRRRGIPGGTFVKSETAGGGAILDIGCYSIDTAMHLMDHPRPKSVSAVTAAPFGAGPRWREAGFDVEDFGAAWVRFDGGAVFLFKISWAMHADSLGPCLFLGTKGGLKIEAGGGLGDDTIDKVEVFSDLDGRPVRTELPLQRGGGRAFLRKMQAFVTAVQAGGPAPIPGRQILRSMAIIDGIYRSAAQGREVDVAAV